MAAMHACISVTYFIQPMSRVGVSVLTDVLSSMVKNSATVPLGLSC